MAATVKVLQKALLSTETLDNNQKIPMEVVSKAWSMVKTKEDFVNAMRVMFDKMVSHVE